MTEAEKEIIIGELLGDGCIGKDKRCKKSTPWFRYTTAKKEYLSFLHQILPSLSWGGIKEYKKKYETFSHTSNDLEYFYNMFYVNGKKKLPKDLKITPLILRHWFIGDGSSGFYSTGKDRHGNQKRSWQITIYSCNFPKIDLENIIIPQLLNLGIKATITKQKHYNRIRISSKSFNNFYKYIGKCPIDCYSYKWEYLNYTNNTHDKRNQNVKKNI